MKQLCLVCVLAALLWVAGTGQGGPLKPIDDAQRTIVPLSSQDFAVEFKGGQRAIAKVAGDRKTYLGLYVYDIHGNCVAWDDRGMVPLPGDLEVEWNPPSEAVYVIEVRNCGLDTNECKLVVR